MACGVPVVATTGGALPEVVGPDGEAARTVLPGDPSALAAAILDLLNDPEERERIGTKGRERVLARFTWRTHAEGLVENWQALLEDQQAHAHR
jgi:glycosyltransferase involved in cell wall biosynthesis